MPLSIKFPLYGSSLVTGPYNVSLSFPGPDSIISKSIGLKESSILLVPNISYITKFIEGNLGIADNMVKKSLFKNLSNPISTNSEEVFARFAENTNSGVGDINKLKDDKGRLKIRETDINLELDKDIGFKMFETIALKSIFETQKPYIELASIVIDSISDIEEIIARLAPLLSTSPLTTKSKKPSANSGSGKKPKAIGFKGNDSKEKIKELKNLTSGGVSSDNEGNVKNIDIIDSNITESNIGNLNTNRYEILSTVYSTGKFDPNVNYKYIYIDLPAELNKKPKLEEEQEDVDELRRFLTGSMTIPSGLGDASSAGDVGLGTEVITLHNSQTLLAGATVYSGASSWAYANATSAGAASYGFMGVTKSTSTGDGIVTRGVVCVSVDPGGSVGDVVYLNTADGRLTTTAPSADGNVVRIMGHKLGTNLVYFNPSTNWVELTV